MYKLKGYVIFKMYCKEKFFDIELLKFINFWDEKLF